MNERLGKPWGHKITFVAYLPGSMEDASNAALKGAEALNDALPSNLDFLGASIGVVEDKPYDQVAT